MSRFQTSEREIAESFLRNLGVELDDTQQEFLGATIGEIQRRIQLNNDEPVDNAVVRFIFNPTGLMENHLPGLIDHVREFSLARRVAEIPDESNSAGVSSSSKFDRRRRRDPYGQSHPEVECGGLSCGSSLNSLLHHDDPPH